MQEPNDAFEELEKLGNEVVCSFMAESIEFLKGTKEVLLDLSYNTQVFLDETISAVETAYNERQDLETPSQALKQTLYDLVGRNRELAERLIASEKEKNPGRTEKWYWEKVIYDIQRDRDRN